MGNVKLEQLRGIFYWNLNVSLNCVFIPSRVHLSAYLFIRYTEMVLILQWFVIKSLCCLTYMLNRNIKGIGGVLFGAIL